MSKFEIYDGYLSKKDGTSVQLQEEDKQEESKQDGTDAIALDAADP